MSVSEHLPAPAVSAREWAQKLGRYRQPSTWRSIYELATTLLPFVACWIAMACAITFGHYWIFAVLLVPTAGFVVRLFMIQHDCGHGSFFPARAANDWTGRLVGILTMTPYDYWRRTHAIHHATAGNLDSRGIGDVDTLTVDEYLARSAWGRLRYRLYRHPVIMFGIGPAYLFVLQYRLPLGFMGTARPWLSTMSTNLAIAVAACLLMWQIGVLPFLLVHIPVVLLAAAGGVWLFYIQHQFEETHWAKDREWTLHEAALHGSSHYDLPPVLRWFTANIGVHHVHHLACRIPYYRLSAVLRDHPELRSVGRITLWQSFACVRLVLWDEARQRLISFRELSRASSLPVSAS